MNSFGSRFQIGSSSPVTMWIAVRESGNLGELPLPRLREDVTIGPFPVGVRHLAKGQGCLLHRSDQADTAFDLAVVQHDAGRRDLHGGTAGLRR